MLTLFINGKYLAQPVTGVQRYAIQNVEAIDALISDGKWSLNVPVVLLVPSLRRHPLPRLRRVQIREIPAKSLYIWEQVALPWAARGSTILNLAGSAPMLKLGQICTFHDTAVFDFPRAYSALFVFWYRLLFIVQGRLSARLLTVSEFSKAQIVKHLKVQSDKVGIVHSAADHMIQQPTDDDILTKLRLTPDGYLIAVGSTNPTKNFNRLVEAFSGITDSSARLVIVGDSNVSVFGKNVETMQGDTRIILAGRLNDSELKSLYKNARAYIFPSVYEGFGLPPIEAMLCNCPVIAARAASIPEICGAGAAYFNPMSVESIRDAINRALQDDHWLNYLRIEGKKRAERYTWNNAATELLRQLERLGLVQEKF
jgi:glycosyltransferase involved in cell wall biosynthesis